MRRSKRRLVLGLVVALLVTGLATVAVAASAAVTIELFDGDTCETDGTSYVRPTPTPENVKTLAGNVADCVVEGRDDDPATGSPPRNTASTSG